MTMKETYLSMGIGEKTYEFCEKIEQDLKERFCEIDKVAEQNQMKVLGAMQKNHVSEACFAATTGYGYNDMGRETLEQVYADTFHTEAALVRPQITCGTHALALALSANLRPGDELLSYRQVDLLSDGSFDWEGNRAAINEKTKVATIQRSKGYQTRPTLSVERIGELISFIKSIKPDVICMVDNCYGEFIEEIEPSDVGADMTVGSLIKNPGGGLAPIGGYICGTAACIEQCAYRLSAPGLGQEVGASLGVLPSFYQGFFLAPTVAAGALKGAVFAANVFEKLGYDVIPNGTWDMPGYDSQVIMAAGAFIQGSSIELSADGPLKEPYAVYFQGGLTWYHAKYGIMMALEKLVQAGIVTL